jgi:hypothetical protein
MGDALFLPTVVVLVVTSLGEIAITFAAAHWLAPFALFRLRVSRRVALPTRDDGYRARGVARPDYVAISRRLEVGDGVVFRAEDGLTYVVRRAFEFGRRRNIWAVRIDLLETQDGLLMTARLVPTPVMVLVAFPLGLLLAAGAKLLGAPWEVGLPLLLVSGVGGAMSLVHALLDAHHRDTTVALVLERLEAELLATLPRR